jgi:hypothetical protein
MLKASALSMAALAASASSAAGPTGARVEPSGFASIATAPMTPARRPEPNRGPKDEPGFYAQLAGVSQAEATKRIDAQNAMRPEFERLLATLRAREPGNFTDARMFHKPDWGYEIYFKRDAASTLAKYTRNPRYKPATAPYSQAELEAIAKPWTDRFTAQRLTSGWGTDDTYGTIDVMMDVTEAEYAEVAAREGWGSVPAPIKLSFAKPLPSPSVDPRVAPLVRVFAQNDRSTGIQLEALGGGRIYMRDGCLFTQTAGDKTEKLAYFHRETGIGLDGQGYLALVDRATGKAKGRLGEMFSWGGPNEVSEASPMVKRLRAQCGNAPLFNVGNPESRNVFRTRYSLR